VKAAIVHALAEAGAPLALYYAIAVAVPVLNGASWDGVFFEHVACVVAAPPLLVMLAEIGRTLVRGATPPGKDT
jgi:hypothetical protein